MKSVELKYSKAKIDKAGQALKDNNLSEVKRGEYLEILSNWRAFHAMPLDIFAKVLKARVKKINVDAIVAQRLKRTPSILLKLGKHSTMRLSTMQDIGGLRAIFDNNEEVYSLIEKYRVSKTRHTLFSLNNYIQWPKEDGYRGVHLVYKLSRQPNIFIEIQVRSYMQHIWATAVEVFGTLKNSSFKSGYGDKEWLDFFKYLSSAFAIKERERTLEQHKELTKEEIVSKIKTYGQTLKVIEQLSVYSAIYKLVSRKTKERGRSGGYSLILLNSLENTISLDTFGASQIELATEEYLRIEKKYFNDIHMNVVLVNTGDIKKLEASYPNYFMDTKKLVFYLSQIIMDQFFD